MISNLKRLGISTLGVVLALTYSIQTRDALADSINFKYASGLELELKGFKKTFTRNNNSLADFIGRVYIGSLFKLTEAQRQIMKESPLEVVSSSGDIDNSNLLLAIYTIPFSFATYDKETKKLDYKFEKIEEITYYDEEIDKKMPLGKGKISKIPSSLKTTLTNVLDDFLRNKANNEKTNLTLKPVNLENYNIEKFDIRYTNLNELQANIDSQLTNSFDSSDLGSNAESASNPSESVSSPSPGDSGTEGLGGDSTPDQGDGNTSGL